MLPHLLTNFETQKYYQNESKFNGICLKNNLHKIKDGAYVENLEEYESVGTHWTVLYVNGDKVTCSDSFEVEYILKEFKKLIENISVDIYRI